jgi:hypothetical protein
VKLVVRLLALWNDAFKPMRVATTEVTPHRMVGAKALVVFAVRSGTRETVPDMSVGVAYAQSVRSLDVRRLVVAAHVLDDLAEVCGGEGQAFFGCVFAGGCCRHFWSDVGFVFGCIVSHRVVFCVGFFSGSRERLS